MAVVHPKVIIEADPLNPVPEICAIIAAMLPYHPGKETEMLQGVAEAIQQRLDYVKRGDDKRGIRTSGRK